MAVPITMKIAVTYTKNYMTGVFISMEIDREKKTAMQVRPTRATTMSQSSQSNLVRLTMRARNRRAVKMVGPTERITASEYCSAGVCVGVRKEGIVFFLLRFVCPGEGSSVERHARNER
jgi:hypothetical protein